MENISGSECLKVKNVLMDTVRPEMLSERLSDFRDAGGLLRVVLLMYFHLVHEARYKFKFTSIEFIDAIMGVFGTSRDVWSTHYGPCALKIAADLVSVLDTDAPPYLVTLGSGSINNLIIALYGFTDVNYPASGTADMLHLMESLPDNTCFCTVFFDNAMRRANTICNAAYDAGTQDTIEFAVFRMIANRTNRIYTQGIKAGPYCHLGNMEPFPCFTDIAIVTLSHALQAKRSDSIIHDPTFIERTCMRMMNWMFPGISAINDARRNMLNNVYPRVSMEDILTRVPIGALRSFLVRESASMYGIKFSLSASGEDLLQYIIDNDFKEGPVPLTRHRWSRRSLPGDLKERLQFIKRYMSIECRSNLTKRFPSRDASPLHELLLD